MNYFYKLIYFLFIFIVYACNKDFDLNDNQVQEKQQTHIPYGFFVQINDTEDCLDIKWNVGSDYIKKIIINAKSENGELGIFSEPYVTGRIEDSIKFWGGTHGELYHFKILTYDSLDNIIWTDSIKNLFIVHSKIPNLPLIKIWTEKWKMPNCKYIKSPDTCIGMGIYNNDYEKGFCIFQQNTFACNVNCKIKIRGNASAWSEKKSFKLKTNEEIDLLFRDDEHKYKHNEWVLLKDGGTTLNTICGFETSKLVGMDFVPSCQLVNLIVNGIWEGLFLLTENVGIGQNYDVDSDGNSIFYRNNVSSTGFIIEHDAYYWNEKFYFKTPLQRSYFGYSFKYPSPESAFIFWDKYSCIKDYMVLVDNSIRDLSYSKYIDVDNFVNFLLVHDVLGIVDGGGSNRFLSKYDYIQGEECSTKLKIGPVWDFDSNYGCADLYSALHRSIDFFYSYLMDDVSKDGFADLYKRKYNLLRTEFNKLPTIVNSVLPNSDDINESRKLDASYYSCGYKTIDDDILYLGNWFRNIRIPWLDENINLITIE